MRNSFSPIGAIIDDKAVASFIEADLAGYALGCDEKVGKDWMILGRNGAVSGVMFFWDKKDVCGGLGSNIPKGENVVVFVQDVGLGFAVDDLFKDRFSHGFYQMVSSRREGLRVRARARMK